MQTENFCTVLRISTCLLHTLVFNSEVSN